MKISIQKDVERAISIKESLIQRRDFLKQGFNRKFSTIVAENYYEIIKEICTAIFLIKGVKFIGEYAHKELLAELSIFSEITGEDLSLADNLRMLRNGSMYYGKRVEESYLINNEKELTLLISKLDKILNRLLEENK